MHHFLGAQVRRRGQPATRGNPSSRQEKRSDAAPKQEADAHANEVHKHDRPVRWAQVHRVRHHPATLLRRLRAVAAAGNRSGCGPSADRGATWRRRREATECNVALKRAIAPDQLPPEWCQATPPPPLPPVFHGLPEREDFRLSAARHRPLYGFGQIDLARPDIAIVREIDPESNDRTGMGILTAAFRIPRARPSVRRAPRPSQPPNSSPGTGSLIP